MGLVPWKKPTGSLLILISPRSIDCFSQCQALSQNHWAPNILKAKSRKIFRLSFFSSADHDDFKTKNCQNMQIVKGLSS